MQPVTVLSGSLADADGKVLRVGQEYDLTAEATDGTDSLPESGVKNIQLLIDGIVRDPQPDQPCLVLNCTRERSWTYVPTSEGDHTVSITTTDTVDNEESDSISFKTKSIPSLAQDTVNLQAPTQAQAPLIRRTDGGSAGDRAGQAVAAIGDVNGDKIADYAVGAPGTDGPGDISRVDAGAVYVVFGSPAGDGIDLSDLGSRGFRISGASLRQFCGMAVSPAGDVNRDGKADLLIGCPGTDGSLLNVSLQGRAFVVFGGSTQNLDLGAPGDRGFEIRGPLQLLPLPLPGTPYQPKSFGAALAGPRAGIDRTSGDVNGDGRDDIIIGSSGETNGLRLQAGTTYVIFGKPDSGTVDVTSLGSQGYRIEGAANNHESGFSVASPGDVNRDGKADVLVGAPGANAANRLNAGGAYVVFGTAESGTVDLGSLQGRGFRIDGPDGGKVGHSVTALGDFNGDYFDDYAVGGHGAYVLRGGDGTNALDLAGPQETYPGYRVVAPTNSPEYDTATLAGGGDLNNDRVLDLVVSFPTASNGQGEGYIVYGQPRYYGDSNTAPITLANLPAQRGSKIVGAGPEFGTSSAGLDDSGNEQPGLVVGAPGASNRDRTTGGSLYRVSREVAQGHAASTEAGCSRTPRANWPAYAFTGNAALCRLTRENRLDFHEDDPNRAVNRGREIKGRMAGGVHQLRDSFGDPFLRFKQERNKQFTFYPPNSNSAFARTQGFPSLLVTGSGCMASSTLERAHALVVIVSGSRLPFIKKAKRKEDKDNIGKTLPGNERIELGIRAYIDRDLIDTVLPTKRGEDEAEFYEAYNSPCGDPTRYPADYQRDQPADPSQLAKQEFFHHANSESSQQWEMYQGERSSAEACTSITSPDCGGFYANYHRPLFMGLPEHDWLGAPIVALTSATTGVEGGGRVRALVRQGRPFQTLDEILYNDPNVPCARGFVGHWVFGNANPGTSHPIYGWYPQRRVPPPTNQNPTARPACG